MIFLLIILLLVVGIVLINQVLWLWFYGRIGHPWNWRALLGPKVYLPWLYERLIAPFYLIFHFEEDDDRG